MDKINPDFLLRDCQIYLLVIYRALTNVFIPVNQMEAILDIEKGLIEWQQKAGDRFDLSSSIKRVQALKENYHILTKYINEAKHEQEQIDLLNNTIMRLSRYFIPLNHVKGSNFYHDPALDQSAISKFEEIEELIKTNKDSMEDKMILISLTRKRNIVDGMEKFKSYGTEGLVDSRIWKQYSKKLKNQQSNIIY